MGVEFGAVFSIVAALLYYFLIVYVLHRKEKSASHYLFALMLLASGTSELLAFFEFTGSPDRAYILLKFDLSSLAIAAYFLLIFAYYFKNGLSFKFSIAALIPVIGLIVMIFTVMIKGIEMGPYGWAGVYDTTCHVIYSITTLSYVAISAIILHSVAKVVEERELRVKVRIFEIATILIIIGGLINFFVILTVGRVFPIAETSVLTFAVIMAYGLTK